MVTKKIKIASSIIIAVVIFLIIIFILKYKSGYFFQYQGINRTAEDQIIKELKVYHPEISTEQLNFYRNIAISDDKAISTCLGREDEKNCVASIAFLKGDKNLCYFHGREGHHDNEKTNDDALKKCVNDVLRKGAAAEVEKCQSLDSDDFFNCIKEIFSTYLKIGDCADLSDKDALNICEDVFNYEDAYFKYDRNLCAEIRNGKLNQYCLKNIIDKSQDTDGDGLTDLDEINKYKTHHLFPDTDGDGISDFEEVNAKASIKK